MRSRLLSAARRRDLHHVPRHDAADRATRVFAPVSPDVSPNGAIQSATGTN